MALAYLPRICNHCANPSCVASCPSGALSANAEDGIVLINQTRAADGAPAFPHVLKARRSTTIGSPANQRSILLLSAPSKRVSTCLLPFVRGPNLRYLGVLLWRC
ncbi:MAG: hypothetical protein IPH10_11230 [bacterium]|nr:hypothetical protein [bacterium]